MTLRVGNLGILTKLIKHPYHGDGVLSFFFFFHFVLLLLGGPLVAAGP